MTNSLVIVWVEGAVGKMKDETDATSNECRIYRSGSYLWGWQIILYVHSVTERDERNILKLELALFSLKHNLHAFINVTFYLFIPFFLTQARNLQFLFCIFLCVFLIHFNASLHLSFNFRRPLRNVWQLLHYRYQFKYCAITDSSVGIATRYGLDGPGIESRWGRDFPHPSRLALGLTQPPIQWVPDLSRG